jgi:hypothetical protein
VVASRGPRAVVERLVVAETMEVAVQFPTHQQQLFVAAFLVMWIQVREGLDLHQVVSSDEDRSPHLVVGGWLSHLSQIQMSRIDG